jgi:hypothetical protein
MVVLENMLTVICIEAAFATGNEAMNNPTKADWITPLKGAAILLISPW